MIARVPVTFANIVEWVRKAATAINALIDAQRGPRQFTTDPADPEPGDWYFNTATSKARMWDGTAWQDLF